MAEKAFLINAIQMIDVEGSRNIPSALHYDRNGRVAIGSEAYETAAEPHEVNTDFKIDLGNAEPNSDRARTLVCADGRRRTARGITGDFLRALLKNVSRWLRSAGVGEATNILLAEPLALHGDLAVGDWLANYRGNLRRILDREFKGEEYAGINFATIDFLPEPFAVFQYYRYGARHPLVSERAKQVALVVDFGGGTCDVCIVETTKHGDISASGKNSKPLAANSVAIGGFAINEAIVVDSYERTLTKASERSNFRQGVKFYQRWRKNEVDLSQSKPEFAAFVQTFAAAVVSVERAKIALCRSVADWSLGSLTAINVPFSIHRDPFDGNSGIDTATLSAGRFRDVFEKQVWDKHIKSTIGQTLRRGKDELGGAGISVVLLSGGSANIGWLRELIRRDFGGELSDAEVLQLDDYQEVVAKGLAVECARRFHAPDGDFAAVTYNRLCLVVEADNRGISLPDFKVRTAGFPSGSSTPGVLLPSASAVQDRVGKPITWDFKLQRPPRKELKYYFLRSSFDPADVLSLQNVEETSVFTPTETHFDAHLKLELLIESDGTASPRFIYHAGRTAKESVAVDGRPFYLDMTEPANSRSAKAFIGLDFGTSNTAVSFVSERSVQVFERRAAESSWLELSDLVGSLPSVLAGPLAHYIGQSDPVRLIKAGREFMEAVLAMCAYLAFLEYRVEHATTPSRLFKGFSQRSAGPLWRLLQDSLTRLGEGARFSKPLLQLLDPALKATISDAVTKIAEEKHEKVSAVDVDISRPIQALANVANQVFGRAKFGFFEGVRRKRMSLLRKAYEGRFRLAHGQGYFCEALAYQGGHDFADGQAFMWDATEKLALSLAPLVFWDNCAKHSDQEFGHCYIFDGRQSSSGGFSFKAAGFPCSVVVNESGAHEELAEALAGWIEDDPAIEFVSV